MTRRTVVAIPVLVPVLRAAESAAFQGRRAMTDLQSAQKAPGMCAAVWKSGSIVWSEAFGLSDLEDGAQVSPQTRFRIGSLSKLLTAAAAARLYEKGILDLDAPIQQYVAGFPPKAGTITARLLLGHLSGLRHYGAGEYLNSRRYSSTSDTLKAISDAPLLQPPMPGDARKTRWSRACRDASSPDANTKNSPAPTCRARKTSETI